MAAALGINADQVLPFSTGVIGQLLPDQIMKSGIVRCGQMLSDSSVDSSGKSAWYAAARGIMTTDTQPKITSRTAIVDGQMVTISGMCKGAGMIQPNMATMLSYVFTDAAVDVQHLNRLLAESVDVSFNSITVDSDTSTNDSCVFVSTGTGPAIDKDHPDWPMFVDAVTDLFVTLAQAVIRDAEGATKFITVSVSGGVNTEECKRVGYAVANSPLVKTALFASDANVGRLVMAIGKSGVENLDASRITVRLGDVAVFERGGIAPGYTEEQGAQAVAGEEIDVLIDLGRGSASAAIYTSDLSHDYVSINADYRS